MSTIDDHGNHHASKGTAGAGQFTRKTNSAPTSGLEALPAAAPTPEEVRSLAFTLESLVTAAGVTGELIRFTPDADGRTRVGWSTEGYGDPVTSRATIDGQGEIVRLEVDWSSNGLFVDAGDDDRELHELRHKINIDRLAFAGIRVHGVDNDGGAYGNRFTGGRSDERLHDAAEISKRIREDLKKAQKVGALPEHLTYRVHTSKFSGGQSITVSCEGISDDQQYVMTHDGFRGRHPWAHELNRTISIIGEQWQDAETEAQTDYFDVLYYFHVDMPDERMQQWREDEKARQAQKRAAKTS